MHEEATLIWIVNTVEGLLISGMDVSWQHLLPTHSRSKQSEATCMGPAVPWWCLQGCYLDQRMFSRMQEARWTSSRIFAYRPKHPTKVHTWAGISKQDRTWIHFWRNNGEGTVPEYFRGDLGAINLLKRFTQKSTSSWWTMTQNTRQAMLQSGWDKMQ